MGGGAVKLNVNAFGPIALSASPGVGRVSQFGGAKPKQIFVRLVLARGHFVTKDALADALWPRWPPQNIVGALESYVSVLRRALFVDRAEARRVIVTGHGGYQIPRGALELDLDAFDELLRRADQAEHFERRGLLQRAVTIAGGDLVEDVPHAEWILPYREMYRASVTRAHLLIAVDAVGDAPLLAVHHGEAALQFSPLAEEAFRVIMLANHSLGHSELARQTFVRCRDALDRGLGVDPTTVTTQLAGAIDAGRPAAELLAEIDGTASNLSRRPIERRVADRRRSMARSLSI